MTDQPNPADNISDRPLAGVFLLLCLFLRKGVVEEDGEFYS